MADHKREALRAFFENENENVSYLADHIRLTIGQIAINLHGNLVPCESNNSFTWDGETVVFIRLPETAMTQLLLFLDEISNAYTCYCAAVLPVEEICRDLLRLLQGLQQPTKAQKKCFEITTALFGHYRQIVTPWKEFSDSHDEYETDSDEDGKFNPDNRKNRIEFLVPTFTNLIGALKNGQLFEQLKLNQPTEGSLSRQRASDVEHSWLQNGELEHFLFFNRFNTPVDILTCSHWTFESHSVSAVFAANNVVNWPLLYLHPGVELRFERQQCVMKCRSRCDRQMEDNDGKVYEGVRIECETPPFGQPLRLIEPAYDGKEPVRFTSEGTSIHSSAVAAVSTHLQSPLHYFVADFVSNEFFRRIVIRRYAILEYPRSYPDLRPIPPPCRETFSIEGLATERDRRWWGFSENIVHTNEIQNHSGVFDDSNLQSILNQVSRMFVHNILSISAANAPKIPEFDRVLYDIHANDRPGRLRNLMKNVDRVFWTTERITDFLTFVDENFASVTGIFTVCSWCYIPEQKRVSAALCVPESFRCKGINGSLEISWKDGYMHTFAFGQLCGTYFGFTLESSGEAVIRKTLMYNS